MNDFYFELVDKEDVTEEVLVIRGIEQSVSVKNQPARGTKEEAKYKMKGGPPVPEPVAPAAPKKGAGKHAKVVDRFRSFVYIDKRGNEKADGSASMPFLATLPPWQIADMKAGIAALERGQLSEDRPTKKRRAT
jgi:hypothetical protein